MKNVESDFRENDLVTLDGNPSGSFGDYVCSAIYFGKIIGSETSFFSGKKYSVLLSKAPVYEGNKIKLSFDKEQSPRNVIYVPKNEMRKLEGQFCGKKIVVY
jgi:hypothetical protein